MNVTKVISRLAGTFAVTTTLVFSAGTIAGNCPSPASQENPNKMTLKSSSKKGTQHGPKVDVIQIQHKADVSKLSAIGIRFRPALDTEIDYQSIRFLYGTFKIDITNRIKKCFDLTQDILVSGGVLPSGTHKLRIEVADRLSRTTEFTVKLQVL